jgi:glycerophosphoryl diester phosphodiesterase
VHDRRVDRVSSGRGVVSEFDLDDLRGLDFGSWHTAEAGVYIEERDSTEAPVLTLARLLEVVATAGRPVRLLVETKPRPGTPDWSSSSSSSCWPSTASGRTR